MASNTTTYLVDTTNDSILVYAPSYPAIWRAEYFANRWLTEASVLVREDTDINFSWGVGSPGSVVPADDFSARWQRYVSYTPGHYRFTVSSDAGTRLWVDDRLLVDQWHDRGGTYTADLDLAAGYHQVRLEYLHHSGNASVQLVWERQ